MPTTGPMSSDQKREIAERKQKNALGLAQQYAVGFKESVQIGVWLHFACNYNPTGKVKGARVVFDRAGLDQARTDFLF